MLNSLMVEFMPPSNAPQLSHTELDTLVGWSSCGLEHPDDPTGLQVDRLVDRPPTPGNPAP